MKFLKNALLLLLILVLLGAVILFLFVPRVMM